MIDKLEINYGCEGCIFCYCEWFDSDQEWDCCCVHPNLDEDEILNKQKILNNCPLQSEADVVFTGDKDKNCLNCVNENKLITDMECIDCKKTILMNWKRNDSI